MSWQQYIGQIVHGDCAEILAQLPDGCIDCVLTDPPYGARREEKAKNGRFGGDGSRFEKYRKKGDIQRTGGTWAEKYGKQIVDWDVAPPPEVFAEIFRVSKNQIIWGGNYFGLPPTRCFNVWRKLTISENFTMAMCEYCWTSFDHNAKFWEFAPQDPSRFHPTQKPVALICRQLEEYTNPGDLVLDCYSGSGTTAIACHLTGRRFICVERNEGYHRQSVERLRDMQQQPILL